MIDLDFTRKIWLDADHLYNKDKVIEYFNELFEFPDYMGKNLDALSDCLSEVNEDTTFLLTKKCVRNICENSYAFKVLILLGNVVHENPHLNILFRE